MKTNIIRLSLAIAAVLSVFSGCLKSPEDTNPPNSKTYISIMHLAPTAPSLDVFFDDTRVSNSSFAPGDVTPVYNPVDKGAFSIKFKKPVTDSLVAEVPLAQYDSMAFYTIFIYNQQANGPAKATRIKDDFSVIIPGSNKSYYRFFHASPNTGAVDLYIDNVKVESGRMPADNTISMILNKFVETTGGSHNIEVRLAGTATVIATLNNTNLLAGIPYTFYLKGLDGGTGYNQLSLGILQASG